MEVEPLFHMSGLGAVVSCVGLAGWFVGSLYLWPDLHRIDRNSPVVIKRRFASVGLACVTAVIYLYFWANDVRLLLQFIQWKGLILPATRLDLIIQFNSTCYTEITHMHSIAEATRLLGSRPFD
jgi:hypothetical protein